MRYPKSRHAQTEDGVWVPNSYVRALGNNEARLFQQLLYWLHPQRASKSHDGMPWIYKTYEGWSADTGLSAKQAERALTKLVKDGMVLKINNPEHGYDRTPWYAVDPDVLADFEDRLDAIGSPSPGIGRCISRNAEMELPESGDGTPETRRAIPETTTETTSETTTRDHSHYINSEDNAGTSVSKNREDRDTSAVVDGSKREKTSVVQSDEDRDKAFGKVVVRLQNQYANLLVEYDLGPEKFRDRNAARKDWKQAFYNLLHENPQLDGSLVTAFEAVVDEALESKERQEDPNAHLWNSLAGPQSPSAFRGWLLNNEQVFGEPEQLISRENGSHDQLAKLRKAHAKMAAA